MKIKEIKSEIIINNIDEHNQYKNELLKLIDEMPNNPYENVTKSDWDLPKTWERKYLDLFYKEVIRTSMEKLQNYFKASDWYISNAWFQQYGKDSYHQWHNHTDANWTNVYFLELPDNNYKTQIIINDEILEYEVKEGELLSFPAHLLHTSPPNGDKRKTVIPFNSNFKILENLKMPLRK